MQNNLKQLISLIEQKTKIEDIISNYVSLERKGSNYIGLCPFHADSNPSMSVSPKKGIFKCFSCQASGNVITFVQNYEGISFIDVLKKLADKANIDWREYLTERKIKVDSKKLEIWNINNEALNFFIYSLLNSSKAQKYVESRGLTKNIINEFQIGWSDGDNKLTNYLIQKKFSKDLIVRSGLGKLDGEEVKDFFINRIMFPIHDFNENVIGFSGRIINDKGYAKYLNTVDTLVFKKGEFLYNYHRAQSPISLKGSVVIVEGFMDVIAYYKASIKNVVATMGTVFTKQHDQKLSKITKNYILSFDRDAAGISAAIKLGKEALNNKIKVKIILPKNGKDIDEFLSMSSAENVERNLKDAEDFVNFVVNILFKSTTKKPDFEKIREVLSIVDKSSDNMQRDYYNTKIANYYNINKDVIQDQIKNMAKEKYIHKKTHRQSININTEEKFLNEKIQDAELELIGFMLSNFEIYKIITKIHYVFESHYGKYLFKLIKSNIFEDSINKSKIKDLLDDFFTNLFVSLENKKYSDDVDMLIKESFLIMNTILKDNKNILHKKQLMKKIENEEDPEQIKYYRDKLKKIEV